MSNNINNLLTRDDFNQVCLERDSNKCRICKDPEGLSVHHIFERKLWTDGGYYKSNGITVCPKCHVQVEAGFILPSELFLMIDVNLEEIVYPDGLDDLGYLDEWKNKIRTEVYRDGSLHPYVLENVCDLDKWGNKILFKCGEESILLAGRFKDKCMKAIRHAGGLVEAHDEEWVSNFLNASIIGEALYIKTTARLRGYYGND